MEIALEKIKRDILLYEFKPGSRLNIEDLKRRYSIGLTPIREALNRLVSIGFAEFTGLKGFKVTQLTKDDLIDIYAARRLIEIKALALAIEKGHDLWESEILASYHRLSKLEKDEKFIAKPDIVAWMKRYQDFHFALLNACQSNWLLTLDKLLFEQSERYRYLRMIKVENLIKLLEKKSKSHKKFIEYILSREKEKAIKLFSDQLDDTINDLLKTWEEGAL